MNGILDGIRGFLNGIGELLGWLGETAAVALTVWVCGVIAFCLLISLFSATRSWYGQVIEWKWNPENLRRHQEEVRAHNAKPENRNNQRPILKEARWHRARTQQYVAKYVGIPMGLGLVGMLAYQVKIGISFEVYAWGAIIWFFTGWLRFWLTMRVSVALNRQRYIDGQKYPKEFGVGQPMELTAWQLTVKRYRWATRTPASDKHQVTIVYQNERLFWLNSVASAIVNFGKLGWLWHIWTAIVVLINAALALVWPATYVGSMILAIVRARETRPEKRTDYGRNIDLHKIMPWWVSKKVSEPQSTVKAKYKVKPLVKNTDTSEDIVPGTV